MSSESLTGGLSRKRVGTPKLPSSSSLTSFKSTSKLTEENVSKDSTYLFKQSDLEILQKLGQGTAGTVYKVKHIPTGIFMARKLIRISKSDENSATIEKQINRELRILRLCRSPFIVKFYGAFMTNDDISIMMEYMDYGTLESLYQKYGPIPVKYISVISSHLLQGLIYLYDNHKVVHRDIKPSNILLCSDGFVKIADFGVSKETEKTLALTFIGTQCFLAPERIKEGSPCTPLSDVWALGLSMMEIALAKFPFPSEAMTSTFDLMQYILQEPSPSLPKSKFSPEFEEFCTLCLIKEAENRPHPKKLLVV